MVFECRGLEAVDFDPRVNDSVIMIMLLECLLDVREDG